MKKYLFLVLMMFSIQLVMGQAWQKNLKAKDQDNPTFYEIQDAFNSHWKDYNVKNGRYLKDGKMVKAPGWKQFKRWEWYWEPRINNTTGEFPTTTSAIEWEKHKLKQSSLKSTDSQLKGSGQTWINLGPSSSSGGYAGIGRINCISFHPSDANTFWVGSPSGGLWRTTDGGNNWTILNDNMDVLGVSDIAIPSDFATSNTIYIATGDRDGGSSWTLRGGNSNDNNSIGVLKSTDGGNTWVKKNTIVVSNQKAMGFLRIHPTDNSILYAGIGSEIYKSSDAGESWISIYNAGDYVIDMEFQPENPSTIYASTQDSYNGLVKIVRSIDDGSIWTTQKTFTNKDARIELAVTNANSTFVYAVVSNTDGGLTGIYKSTNSGDEFLQVFDGTTSGNSLLGWYGDGSGTNDGQAGSYDLAFTASPSNENTLFLGGINTWKSTDGGITWFINNAWTSSSSYNPTHAPTVHADKHCLKFQNNTTLFEGNDGGIYKTTNNGASWTDLSDGLMISQIYRIGVSATNSSSVISGLQDNGSKQIATGNWSDISGGDGMECIIDHTDANIRYTSYPNGEIDRLDYNTRTDISVNIDGGANGYWVTPYIIDPVDHNTIYVGYGNVWKSTNKGDSFSEVSSMYSSAKLRSMAIAPSNNQVMYVADRNDIWTTTNGGTDWTTITGTLPTGSNSITYIAVKHTDPYTLWVTVGGYTGKNIYESTDGGSTWTNISTGLPNLPTFCVVQNKLYTSENHLYVGTDRGVYFKKGNDDWIAFSNNLPNVMVTELEIYYDNALSKIRAATFGRGLWESSITTPINVDAGVSEITQPINSSSCGEQTITPEVVIRNSGNNPITSFTLSYSINDGTAVSSAWTGTLNTGETETITFANTIQSTVGINTFTATLSNVNSGTDDDTANDSKSVNFEISDTNPSLPITEGFNRPSMPGCWTSEIITDNSTLNNPVTPVISYVTTGSGNPVATPIEGTHMLNFNSAYCDDGDQIRLTIPSFSTIGKSGISISFYWHEDNNYVDYTDIMTIQWSMNGAEWFDGDIFQRNNAANPGWQFKSYSLPARVEEINTLYIRLLFTSAYGQDCNLDNLQINYNTITTGTIVGSPFAVSTTQGASINIPFTINETFTSNTFTAYLSDASGLFVNETPIGTLVSNDAGTISGTIPANTTSGTGYKIRVKSSNPVFTGSVSNTFAIVLDNTKPTIAISSSESNPTTANPINIVFTFSEAVTGFELGDITVENGTADNFITTNSSEYSAHITPSASGSVTVDVAADVATDVVGNTNTAATQFSITYNDATSIEELIEEGISIYPNPVSNNLTINLTNTYKTVILRIIDMNGKIVSSEDLINNPSSSHDMSGYPKGMYIIQLILDGKPLNTQLIVQ